jgi:uncharacterized protein YukE
MTDLTPGDVRHWDAEAVLKVFQVANARGQTLHQFGDDLGQTGQLLAEWHGEAGSAFHSSLGRLRTDIETDGQESRQVAGAVSTVWEDVQVCKAMMSGVDQTAETLGFTITEDWKVGAGDTAALLMGPQEAELQRQILQTDLDTVKIKAHTTDHELATAMRAAVGDSQPDSGGGAGAGPTVTKGDVAIGAAGAVAGGTADGVREATTRLIEESPGTGPGKAPPGLLKWFEDPTIAGAELKGFSPIGRVVGAASAVPAVMSNIHDGNSVAEAVTREGAGVAAGLYGGAVIGGLAADAVAGATIGSVVPGAGTAVGLVVGAGAGAVAAWIGSKTVEELWQPVTDAVGNAVRGVESVFGFG